MEKVFFDTNVYNHLTDENASYLKTLIDNKAIEIFTNPHIVEEIISSFINGESEKNRKLIRRYRKLISNKIIKDKPQLLLGEIEYIRKHTKYNIFLNDELTTETFNMLENFEKGLLAKQIIEVTKESYSIKKNNFKFMKNTKKDLDPLWTMDKRNDFPDFDSFWMRAFNTGNVRKEIKSYLRRLESQGILTLTLIEKICKLEKKLEKNLCRLPHLEAAIKINPALSYRYHIQRRGAKKGDLEDTMNLISVATLDTYVSDDVGALEICKLVFPGKKAMSLDNFMSQYKDRNRERPETVPAANLDLSQWDEGQVEQEF